MTPAPLAGLHVLEIAHDIAGPYAARLLADLGADVVKVEPPTGDPARALGPFPSGQPDPERSGLFLYANGGKRGVVLDLGAAAGRRACLALVAGSDVLIETWPPGAPDRLGLGAAALRGARPDLVRVSVTPFGQWGPRAHWRGNDLIAFHSSGFAHGFPSEQVDGPDLPPLNAPSFAAELLAGQVAASAAIHGLLVRQQSGRGSHLDVSLQEAVAAANHTQFNTVERTGAARRRFSDAPTNATVALLPCSDGWVAISPREEHQWLRWLEVMGHPAWGADPRFADRGSRERHWAALYPLLADWSRGLTRAELFEATQARRVACYPLGTATDVLGSPQLAARDFFVRLPYPELGELVLPGRPYHMADEHGPVRPPPARPAPRLGEHTGEVLAELAAERPGERPPVGAVANGTATDPLRPLAGVRIVDFSWVMTGPICTKYLAALGADVIKVESATRPDLSHRDLSWQDLNPSKRSVTLNLKDERARDLARRLVARADVVVENFSTGVMERLGLDYPALRAVNPRIIMASSSALGRTGPERERVAYGTLIQCFTGWATQSAHPGRPPRSPAGIWTDPLTAVFEVLLLLAALWRQRATGAGCFFDLSMAETTIAALPEPILAWCMAGQQLAARGNRHPAFAPQGCYPALGDDRWVALSVQSDAEWSALCDLMGRPDLLADGRLASAQGRRDHHDELDASIAGWTAQVPADEVAARLQARGIAASPTAEPGEVVSDPHLVARAFASQVERLEGGTRTTLGVPWLIDRQRPDAFRRPPRPGEHNEEVFRGLLSLGHDEFARLVAERVIY